MVYLDFYFSFIIPDLFLFIVIKLSELHCSIILIDLFKSHLFLQTIAISSANASTSKLLLSNLLIKSLIKILKNKGDKIDPYKTPLFIGISSVYDIFILLFILL